MCSNRLPFATVLRKYNFTAMCKCGNSRDIRTIDLLDRDIDSMAKIVLITHTYDKFTARNYLFAYKRKYLIRYVLRDLRKRGHKIAVMAGPDNHIPGDVALLHADCSVVSPEYVEAAARFPFAINGTVADIRKSVISDAVMSPDSDWRGPVIVKTDLNGMGTPEGLHNFRARAQGHPLPHPNLRILKPYEIYPSLGDVPGDLRDDPRLVVEKFIPEPDPDGYAIRNWIFMGDHEKCMRNVSRSRIVKGLELIRQEPVEVPDAIRERRRQLGFEYGKFDFVIHDGAPVLLDANRTPMSPRPMRKLHARNAWKYADGFERLIAKAGIA